jgi:hypothetical protein
MTSPCGFRRGLVFTAFLAVLVTLAGCVTSEGVLLNAASTPAKPGRYEVQYHVDGKWTKVAAGSLALVDRTYAWTEDREVLSLLKQRPNGLGFRLVDIGNNYFIVVVASADLGSPIWVGRHMYGIARRADGAFQYDFPSCLDLLMSQGLANYQLGKINSLECLYSDKTSLTSALIAYAKHTAFWKRLAPSGH